MKNYIDGLKYKMYVGKIMNLAVEAVLRHKYQLRPNPTYFKGIVYIANGLILHGGLSDRLRGCISLYYIAKKLNIPFKIYFVSPFHLEDYLEPNEYDWRIDDSLMDFSLQNTNIIYIYNRDLPFEHSFQENYLKERISPLKQNHIFTNIDLGDCNFSELFHELFKPNKQLSLLLQNNKKLIGNNYIAMVYRFQQLLGDFKEGNFPVLEKDEQIKLLQKCRNAIIQMHQRNPNSKILVTSDSSTFLELVNDIKYVYVIKGTVYHMDFYSSSEKLSYMKSFLDLFMLSEAKYIYLVKCGLMYHSGFAKRASLINNIPYKVLNIY